MKHKYSPGQRLLAAVAVGTLLYSCHPQVDLLPAETGQARVAAAQNYVPGELLIKFKKGTDDAKVNRAFSTAKANRIERILTRMMEKAGDVQGVNHVKTSLDVMAVIGLLKGLPEVEYAEPNYIYTTDATANEPYFTNGSLWGMYGPATSPANQYGCQAAVAWNAGKTGASTVIVGIIDEGWMTTHSDLAGNGWVNPYETVNKKDDDGNGYIDDVNGWDFAANDNTIYDGPTDDHGTHVAGIIGGKGGNALGVAGVCWNVKMIGLKFMGTNGGTTANAIKAIDYLTDMKIRHPTLNIVASNNSWGGGAFSQTMQNAIERANAANILFVAAAGNGGSDSIGDNNDVVANYPSNYPNANVIAVAAITSAGARSSFSNYGTTQVDIGAPGSGIWSTVPGSGNTSTYASYNGTSMAAPFVTGAVALYKSVRPTATAAQIKAAILSTGLATPSLAGKCVTGKRLNVSSY